jgi:dolichol-phosphate mannosyltransferase
MSPALSVVIPVHNEAGALLPLVGEIIDSLSATPHAFEIILVNDGSTDSTTTDIATAMMRWPNCTSIQFSERRGQAIALLAGLRAARGAVLVTLDGDGQNDPHDIPALLAPIDAGVVDLACGWRTDRRDRWLRRVISRLGNRVRRTILHDGVHDAGCQLRVFRREVADVLEPMNFLQTFIPAIAIAAGFRVREIPVSHRTRRGGTSKYGLRQLWWQPALAMLRLRWNLHRYAAARQRSQESSRN